MLHSSFNSQTRFWYLSFILHSFNLTMWSAGTAKSTILEVLFFAIDYYKVWSSSRDQVIFLHVKIRVEFVWVILQDRLWLVQIAFVRMVIFKFLAQLPMDHCKHPVMSSLIVLCTNLLHSLIIWLMVSCLSPHNLH